MFFMSHLIPMPQHQAFHTQFINASIKHSSWVFHASLHTFITFPHWSPLSQLTRTLISSNSQKLIMEIRGFEFSSCVFQSENSRNFWLEMKQFEMCILNLPKHKPSATTHNLLLLGNWTDSSSHTRKLTELI